MTRRTASAGSASVVHHHALLALAVALVDAPPEVLWEGAFVTLAG